MNKDTAWGILGLVFVLSGLVLLTWVAIAIWGHTTDWENKTALTALVTFGLGYLIGHIISALEE